jgi:L-iditol 2-dehydrogenase
MKAFMVFEPSQYSLVDIPVPAIREDEVLVKVGAAAICHSDLDIIEGRRTHSIQLPVVTGHEFAGTVADVGKYVSNVHAGDAVVCECILWCGACRNCRLGLTSMCGNFNELGTMRNGGFAQYAAVPAKMVHKFSKITMNEASNVEPAGNALHAVEEADIRLGDKVVVIGPGPIGLYALQFARLKCPEMLIMAGTRDERLQLAKQLGATHTVNTTTQDAAQAILELTAGKGADRVIQCATTESAMRLALRVAGANSRIAIEGFGGSGRGIDLDFNDFIIRPMSITGVSGVFSRHYMQALELMEAGFVDAKPVITHTLPLDSIVEGFDMLRDRRSGAIKVVINP